MKKTIATFVASVMVLGTGVINTTAFAESRYEEAIGAMGALEIMVGDAGSTDFRENDPIKRSEFAKVAIHALGLSEVAASFVQSSAFPDVAEDHWAKGYIATAAQQGIVIGDTEGNFRPDDPVSYEEAITVLVRMAGYEVAAQSAGGYPVGYLTVGQNGGMLDKIPAQSGPASRGMVAQMTYNALKTPMMEKKGETYTVTENTLLESRLHAEEVRGILEATSHSALSGDGAGENRIRIDGSSYETDLCGDALLGQAVRGLVREEEGEKTVFFLTADTIRTKIVSVKAEDVLALSREGIRYEKDLEQVTESFASGVQFVINGRPAEAIEPPAEGVVTLISNQGKEINVVLVTSYENMVVENVYAAAGKVTGTKGETLTLDLADKTVSVSIRDAEGNSLTVDELKTKDVLSVAKSRDEAVIRIMVGRETVSGTVEEISGKQVTVADKTYTLSAGYSGTLIPGDRVTLRLDAYGKIAATEKPETEGAQYAYLLKAKRAEGINGKLLLSVLDTEGKTETLYCAENIRLDDTAGVTAEAAESTLSSFRGLVRLAKNDDGIVTEIDRADDETASFPQSFDNRFVLNTLLTDSVFSGLTMKLGSVRIDENTVFFSIPDGETDSEKYTAGNYTLLTDKTEYNAYVYDMKEDMTAGAIILTGTMDTVRADAPILVVSRITGVQNAQGATVHKLYGLTGEGEVSKTAAEGVSLSHLAEGDIIQYRTDAAGNIQEVRTLLTADNRDTEAYTALSDSVETVYGKVVARFASSLNVSVQGRGTENFAVDKAKVYLFDQSRTAGRVQEATLADVTRHTDDGSRIFLRLVDGMATDIVIVK